MPFEEIYLGGDLKNPFENSEVPSGEYHVQFDKWEDRTWPSGDSYISLWLTVIGGEFNNRKIFLSATYESNQQADRDRGLWGLRQFISAATGTEFTGRMTPELFDSLVGSELLADVFLNKNGFHRINDFKAIAGAPKPAARTAPKPAAAASGAAQTMPWNT